MDQPLGEYCFLAQPSPQATALPAHKSGSTKQVKGALSRNCDAFQYCNLIARGGKGGVHPSLALPGAPYLCALTVHLEYFRIYILYSRGTLSDAFWLKTQMAEHLKSLLWRLCFLIELGSSFCHSFPPPSLLPSEFEAMKAKTPYINQPCHGRTLDRVI